MGKTTNPTDFTNLVQLTTYFNSEEKCYEYLRFLRWEDGEAICPCCGSETVYSLMGRMLKCADKECKRKFSVTTGTIFEASKIPLRTWFIALYLVSSHKKGVSSHQLAKDLGITQKSAWFVLGRIREMLTQKAPELLEGVVEIDEAYIGGKETNKHLSKRRKGTQDGSGKQANCVGLLEQGGNVVAFPIPDRPKATLHPSMRNNAVEGSTLYTDEHAGYRGLTPAYRHEYVTHGSGQYVNGIVTTNGIENFWSQFKRDLYGVHHHYSVKYLHRYLTNSRIVITHANLERQKGLTTR